MFQFLDFPTYPRQSSFYIRIYSNRCLCSSNNYAVYSHLVNAQVQCKCIVHYSAMQHYAVLYCSCNQVYCTQAMYLYDTVLYSYNELYLYCTRYLQYLFNLM